jgi:hypothetical protein
MGKFLIYLLLLIVPVQLAWANSACFKHEDLPTEFTHQPVSAEYLQHGHEHSQKLEKNSSLAKQDQQTEKHTAHCDACHAHLIIILEENQSLVLKKIPNDTLPSYEILLISALSDPPYRPKWRNS